MPIHTVNNITTQKYTTKTNVKYLKAAPCPGTIPEMPTKPVQTFHRDKFPIADFGLNACVARPVNKKEQATNPKCAEAKDKEWTNLSNRRVWDVTTVKEWHKVAQEANAAGKTIHMGRVFGIMVEKNYEAAPKFRK